MLRPLVVTRSEPADPHDHQLTQPRIQGPMPEHAGKQVVEGPSQLWMVQQYLEDAEFGHVVRYARFVGSGLGLVERQSRYPRCCHSGALRVLVDTVACNGESPFGRPLEAPRKLS